VEHLRRACPAVQHWIAVGQPYEDLLAARRLPRPDLFSIDEAAIAELFYTSGSTGTPKGVMLSHRTLYLHAYSVMATFVHSDDNVELHTIPLFHANGWGRAHSTCMMGLTQVMVRRFDPSFVLRLIEQEKATGMALVPTMANAILNCPELGKHEVSSMKDIMMGGAAASSELVARMEKAFPGARVFAGYGLTESAPVATCARPKGTVQYADEDDRLRHQAMAGWPVPGCEVRVVDLQLNDVPRDGQSIGEVVMRGDNIMEGYYKEPKATADVMTDGWLHTGDMAVWDPENYIHIVDRKKDIIISGGENISTIEVEQVVVRHAAVLECAVVAIPDEKWGERPKAFVTLRPGMEVTAAEIIAFCRDNLAHYKCPVAVEFGELPKTSTGKVQKFVLREREWAGYEKRIN
jgi:fatty-acyl-CoA synthase